MKLIGISGAQGAGKSTMLKELAARGWHVDEFKVSRAVQAMLRWDSLDRVMDSPETMMQFQEEVFTQKFKNDSLLFATPQLDETQDAKEQIILTERTFADVLAYTSHWCWQFVDQGRMTINEALDFLSPFTGKCQYAQQKIYAGTILLPLMDHIIWEDDPSRAKQSDARLIFENIEQFIERKMPVGYHQLNITTASVQERADQVEFFLRRFNGRHQHYDHRA